MNHVNGKAKGQLLRLEHFDIHYWRTEFRRVIPRFESLTEVHELIGPLDRRFSGIPGYNRLRNIMQGRGSIELTGPAVYLMMKVRPDPTVRARNHPRQRSLTESQPVPQ